MTALHDLTVLELAGERTGFVGRLLAELGADVIVVEPPEGSPVRGLAPFVGDVAGPDASLRWWAEAAGKRSVEADLSTPEGRDRFAALVSAADIVVEGAGHDLDVTGCGWDALGADRDGLVWVSITPFGRESGRSGVPVTDLTLMAGGGPVWNCGYDDHTIPPMRGAGDQSDKIAGYYAAIGAMVAIVARDAGGPGQLVDVSVNAACNVTAEHATYNWLLIKEVCTRQTGRHAYYTPTAPVQVRCADGAYATTGVLPRMPHELADLHGWLAELDLLEELPEAIFLEMAGARDEPVNLALVGADDEITAIAAAARDAIALIASHLPAVDFYEQSQTRGFPTGAILSPDEAFEQPHFIERGLQVEVPDPTGGGTHRQVGVPARWSATPPQPPTAPPRLGQHTDEVLAEIERRGRP